MTSVEGAGEPLPHFSWCLMSEGNAWADRRQHSQTVSIFRGRSTDGGHLGRGRADSATTGHVGKLVPVASARHSSQGSGTRKLEVEGRPRTFVSRGAELPWSNEKEEEPSERSGEPRAWEWRNWRRDGWLAAKAGVAASWRRP